MKGKGKDVKGAKTYYRVGAQLKDVIPLSIKNPPRDPRPYKVPDQIPPIAREGSELEAFKDPDEWPGDDQAKQFDFLAEKGAFHDVSDSRWPPEYNNQGPIAVFWRRPKLALRKEYPIDDPDAPPRLKKISRKNNQKPHISELLFLKEDTYSTYIESESKREYMEKEIEQQLMICESFERDETQEECERRKKDWLEKQAQLQAQFAKDKKKQPKKQEEVFDENLIKVKDVRLTDVCVFDGMPPDGLWIASQLQVIKDRDIRDVNTNKPLWSKIYPQQDGAPIYNPNGRYWVKLYFMGKERKIEIDDRIPINFKQDPLLPWSSTTTQLWPIIISKALLKLLGYQRKNRLGKVLTGDGFVMYSLLGFISETIPLKQMSPQQWGLVDQALSEQHYNQKDYFVNVFTDVNTKIEVPTNSSKKKSRDYINELVKNINKWKENYEPESAPLEDDELKLKQEGFQGSDPIRQDFQNDDATEEEKQQIHDLFATKQSFYADHFQKRYSLRDLDQPPLEETFILPGFSYSVIEQFQNENFNMVYVQKRSEREQRLRQEYYDICKANIHKMSKEEKLEHRRRRKEIKEKNNEDDRKRIELITKPAIQHRLMRIKTSIQNCQPVQIACPFSAEEIYIARKCIVNRLTKPPNYDLPEIKNDDKSVVSQTVKNQQQIDDTFQIKPLDDFTSIMNVLEPLRRGFGGFWLLERDVLQAFQYMQICYDPSKFETNNTMTINENKDNEITTYDDMEMLIVKRNPEKEENAPVTFLIGFQPKYSSNFDLEQGIRPFTVLQRFDLEQYESIYDYKVLNQYVSGQMILLDNKNNIFRIQTYSPLAYQLWMSSSNQIQTLSIYDYFVDYEGYQAKKFTVEYPAITQKQYYCFFRYKILVKGGSKDYASFVFRIRSTVDNNILKSLRLKLIETPPSEGEDPQYMLATLEGVHKNLYETTFILSGTQRIQIRKDVQYFLLLEGILPYTLQEGTFDIDFLLNNDFEVQIDLIEQVEPTIYIDKFIPSKYGIIFREKLFVNDNTFTSLFVRLAEVQQQIQQQQVDKKAPKGKQGNYSPEQTEVVDTQLKGERLLKLELFCNDQLLQYSYGINQTVLSNIPLKSTKDESKVYILQASFDLREWPEAKELSPDTELIHWFLTIFSTDTVGVLRDTTKEDREKAIKKSWEDKEPGRAERAKKCRGKFQISKKKERGDDLTEEEQTILNQPRISKKQREEEAKQLIQTKGKAVKKEEKKGKPGKKEEVVQEVVHVKRDFPKSVDHVTEDIFHFLKHLESDRIMEQYAMHAGLINVRNDAQKREIIEGLNMAKEEATAIFQRNMALREELKLYQRDQKEIFLNDYQTWRKQFKENLIAFNQKRELLKQSMSQKIKREREILDICKQEKPTIDPEVFEKQLNEAQEAIPDINNSLIQIAKQTLKNMRINQLGDKLNNAINNLDLDGMKTCLELIELNSVETIDPQLIGKAEEMLEEAAGNPNWLAEKQAELKKMGKKGKK